MKRPVFHWPLLAAMACFGMAPLSVGADTPPDNAAMTFLQAMQRQDTAAMTQLLQRNPGLVQAKLDGGRTLLDEAIDSDEPAAVAALLAAGMDVNRRDDAGAAPLQRAAHVDPRIVLLLLQKGADVNAKDSQGNTPLTEALSVEGYQEIVSLLLKRGADVNERDGNGFTPLRRSVEPREPQSSDVGLASATLLLRHGASYGNPFFDAIAKNDLPALKAQAKADPSLVNRRYAGLLPLDQAVFWQNYAVGEWLISQGADINAKNDRGETPIIHTLNEIGADEQDGGFVSLLLAHHARLNIADKSGQTPLWIASFLSYLGKKMTEDLLGELIANGAEVNAPGSDGSTVLIALTSAGYFDSARFLLRHGASYRSPFLDAVAHGNAAVKTLLAQKPTLATARDASGNSALAVAAFWKQKPLISLLLAHGASLNAPAEDGESLLMKAVESDDRDMVAFLASKGAKVNLITDAGQTPLGYAIQHAANTQDTRMVALLLAAGARPQDKHLDNRENALGAAVFFDVQPIVALLLQKGMDVNDSGIVGETPLHRAVGYRHKAIARLLLQHGGRDSASPLIDAITQRDLTGIKEQVRGNPALLNARVKNMTPLYDALFWGDKDVVALLLDLGADPNRGLQPGSSALTDLVELQSWRPKEQDDGLAALLLARGADVNFTDANLPQGRETPLAAAVYWGNKALTALFLQKGAQVDVRDSQGQTPLFQAVRRTDPALITLLLDHGAAVNARDDGGQTPLRQALEDSAQPSLDDKDKANYQKVIALLRRRGATD